MGHRRQGHGRSGPRENGGHTRIRQGWTKAWIKTDKAFRQAMKRAVHFPWPPEINDRGRRGIENMQTQHITKTAFLTLLLAILVSPCVAAEMVPSFEQIYASNDKNGLTAWGYRYARGVGVAKDTHKAIKLFCKSARKGDTDAKFELGQFYAFGPGIERDWQLATAWYQAVKDKSRKAQMMLEILKVQDGPVREVSCPLPTERKVADTQVFAHIPAFSVSKEINRMVRSIAPKYRLDPNLVFAIIEAESSFNPKALSSENAQGLMQLIPTTAERFGVRDVWDPEQNLKGGMAYLRWLLDHFEGNVELALAGYNAGERVVERYQGIPPYAETQAYVKRIIKRIGG